MKRLSLILLSVFLVVGLVTGCNHSAFQTDSSTHSKNKSNKPLQFTTDALANYTIVYSKDAPEYAQLANQLADRILEKYDIFLTAVCDTSTPPADYEIILGDTNRSQQQGRIMEYSVTVDSGKFQIHAGGAFSAQEAVNFLCDNVFNGESFSLDNGQYYATSFLANPQTMDDSSTARIMSANILADVFLDDTYKSAHYRAEIFAGMLIYYTPDVLGLQEADENWNTALDTYLPKLETMYGIAYTKHLSTYENKTNYTSLLYRSDKFQVLDDGIHVFSWWTDKTFSHNYHMRNISWAKFSPVSNPEQAFIVANTHWSFRTEHANGKTYLSGSGTAIQENELRLQCKEETNTFMSSLKAADPQTPIFLTGDFNTSLPFFTDSGWTPADFHILSEEAKNSGTALSLVPTSGHFDHIFGAGNYTIDIFKFFTDDYGHSLLTDHPFVYADLSF